MCSLTMWTYHEAAISSWRWLFLSNDYNSMAMTFVTKLNFWRRKRPFARSAYSQRSLREAPVRVTSCECHVFELFVFEHIFRK